MKRVSCSHYQPLSHRTLIDSLYRLLGVAGDLQIESAEGCPTVAGSPFTGPANSFIADVLTFNCILKCYQVE